MVGFAPSVFSQPDQPRAYSDSGTKKPREIIARLLFENVTAYGAPIFERFMNWPLVGSLSE